MKQQDSKGKLSDTKGEPALEAPAEKTSTIQGNDNTGATQEQKETGELNSAKTNGIIPELQASHAKKEQDSATSVDEVPAVEKAVKEQAPAKEGRTGLVAPAQFKSSITENGVMDEHHEDFSQTRGAQLVVLNFNPDNNGEVQNLKVQAAKLINSVDALAIGNPKAARWAAEAITNIETGAMFAVKAATSK